MIDDVNDTDMLFFLSFLYGSESHDSVRLVNESLMPEYFSRFFSRFDLNVPNASERAKCEKIIQNTKPKEIVVQKNRTYFKFGALYLVRASSRPFAKFNSLDAFGFFNRDFSLHHSTWRS